MEFSNLAHVQKPLPHGGRVLVLDTGALIGAEAEAMLQALHSRSIGGVRSHLEKLEKKGPANFMETYYVGYGDKSIGDCGSTTIFIEGVSMLVAKAIQDSQLYNGQESSTRYIDFSNQPFLNPAASAAGEQILEELRAFHLEGLETMKAILAERHPRQEQEEEKVWQKAINARAFDVMRSFLPAGAVTNLAWHTELRHAADHLMRLRHHPLAEVRTVAEAIQTALDEKYPSSFKQKRYEQTESYVEDCMRSYYFNFTAEEAQRVSAEGIAVEHDGLDHDLLQTYRTVFSARPFKAEPPKYAAECGSMRFAFFLDFGSFRDLQRHRAVVQRMPLLTDAWGFEAWYLAQMPEALQEKAISVLEKHRMDIQKLQLSAELQQYYLPMGYRVACRITGDLPALLWLVELRSGTAVHPTLRTVAQAIGAKVQDACKPIDIAVHINTEEDRFNIKRGLHDIVEKTP